MRVFLGGNFCIPQGIVRAKAAAKEALEALPDNPQVIALTAMTIMMTEGHESAQELIDRAMSVSPIFA